MAGGRHARRATSTTIRGRTLPQIESWPILAGQVLGALLPYSGSVTTREGRAVAACIVTDRDGVPPHGGTWVAELFRDPIPRTRGPGGRCCSARWRSRGPTGVRSRPGRVGR